jgi:hypothetical protein
MTLNERLESYFDKIESESKPWATSTIYDNGVEIQDDTKQVVSVWMMLGMIALLWSIFS